MLHSASAIGLAAVCVVSPAIGAAINNPLQLSGISGLVNFEGQALGPAPNPLTITGATFSSANGLSITDLSGFGANGTEVSARTLNPTPSGGLGGPFVPIRIEFESDVREVLLGWFDPNFIGNVLRAYRSDGGFLESAAVATGPTGGGHAAWIGIARDTRDIAYVEVVPAAINDVYTIDNVHWWIPAPGASALLLLGALGGLHRRR